MTSPRSAQVIGGGIVGLSVALALQQRGVAVRLVDPGIQPPPASWGNAGHIATEQVEPLASWKACRSLPSRLFVRGGPVCFPLRGIAAWLPFGTRFIRAATPSRFAKGKAALGLLMQDALPAWRRLVTHLDAGDLLREEGHYIVWENEASARRARSAWHQADTGATTWRNLEPDESRMLQGQFCCPIADAIRFEGSASVRDPGEILNAMRRQFARNGGDAVKRLAASVRPDHADITVVCAGIGSTALIRPLGHRVPMIAERGYHIEAGAGTWGMGCPPIVFEDRSMVVTRFGSTVRATSFVEFAQASTPPDPRKWRRLRAHALAVGLPMEGDVSEWMGARPTLPDYLPAIGRSELAPHILYAFGHQHLGLTLGPITGELIAAQALGETPPIDLAPFSLTRFD